MKPEVAVRDIFQLRNVIQSQSVEEYRAIVSSMHLNMDDVQHLLATAYQCRRNVFMEYLVLFAKLYPQILQASVCLAADRNILEELCLCGKVEEVVAILKIMPDTCVLDQYDIVKLLINAINNTVTSTIGNLVNSIGHQKGVSTAQHGILIMKELVEGGLCGNLKNNETRDIVEIAIKKQQYAMLQLLLEHNLYTPQLGKDRFLFLVASRKWSRKDKERLIRVMKLLLEKNSGELRLRGTDESGRTVFDLLPKEYHGEVEQLMKTELARRDGLKRMNEYSPTHSNSQSRKPKVKSQFGGGRDILKQTNEALRIGISNSLHGSGKQAKQMIVISSSQDEKVFQKEANQIFKKEVESKDRNYRMTEQIKPKLTAKQKVSPEQSLSPNQNMASKHTVSPKPKLISKPQSSSILSEEELKYYLDVEIKYQTNKIKQENNRYKQFCEQLIGKIKNKLTLSLSVTVEIFGSFATSLCLPESDIDVVIIPTPDCSLNSFNLLENVHQLLLEMKEEILTSKLIKTATVPIVKVQCTQKYNLKKIDITYRDSNHNGLQSVQLIRKYLEKYAVLEPLIFILKKFIYASNLFSPYTGGISSYGLILMIVAYLQNEHRRIRMEKLEEPMLSELLLGFLNFYGFKNDYISKCICIYDPDTIEWDKYPGCFLRHSDMQPHNGIIDPKLVILDPLNPSNNVGRSTHKIKQIRMAFQIALISIHSNKNCSKKKRCELYKLIKACKVPDVRYADNPRPCCILKRMFKCTDKFLKNDVCKSDM